MNNSNLACVYNVTPRKFSRPDFVLASPIGHIENISGCEKDGNVFITISGRAARTGSDALETLKLNTLQFKWITIRENDYTPIYDGKVVFSYIYNVKNPISGIEMPFVNNLVLMETKINEPLISW